MAADASCTAYVSMLRARRSEDERARKRRSERRADYVNANQVHYNHREREIRQFLMKCKLAAHSQMEEDLFLMLNEQAQWRHVIRQNVQDREVQLTQIVEEQRTLFNGHLQHMLRQEVAASETERRDDQQRYEAVRSDLFRARAAETSSICRAAVDGVVELAFSIIDFIEQKQIIGDPGVPAAVVHGSVFESIPRCVFDQFKLPRMYSNADEMKHRILEDYVMLVPVGTPDPSQGFSSLFHALMERIALELQPNPPPLQPRRLSPQCFIVLSGPKYSGKTTAARRVAGELDLEYVSDTTLVEEMLAALERDITPDDIASQEAMSRLDYARELQILLRRGESVSDEFLARLVLFKIQFIPENQKGIIFDGVPRTAAGFVTVEKELSGYAQDYGSRPPCPLLALNGPVTQTLDLKVLDVERPTPLPVDPVPAAATAKEAKKAAEAVKAASRKDKKKEDVEEPLPPVELPPVDPVPPLSEEEQTTLQALTPHANEAGLRRIIRIHCDSDVIFDRYSGIRVDAENGNEYHVLQNPPPLDRVPFLVARDRSEADTAKLHAAIQHDDAGWTALRRVIMRYDDLLREAESNCPLEDLVSNVKKISAEALESTQARFRTIQRAMVLRKERAELEQLYAERIAHREAIRKQLAQIYAERGIEPLPLELQETNLNKAPESALLPLPKSTPLVLTEILETFTRYFADFVFRVQEQLSHIFQLVYDHGVWAATEFQRFLNAPDGKQKALEAFVRDLNAMSPTLRRDVQGKEELHLRVDALLESLRGAVDKRREEGSALIDTLLAAASCIDPPSEGVRLLGSALVQIEAERFHVVRYMAFAYYGGIKAETIPHDEGIESAAAMDFILPIKSVLDAAAALAEPPKGVKDPKGKPPPKKAAPVPAVVAEETKPLEDIVTPLVEKACASIKLAVDKLQLPASSALSPPAKGSKTSSKAAAEAPMPTADGPSLSALCVPLVASEYEATKFRIIELGKYTRSLLERITDRHALVRAKLGIVLKQRIIGEMSALNGCANFLRRAIEQESVILHVPHLDGTKFSIDYGRFFGGHSSCLGVELEAGKQEINTRLQAQTLAPLSTPITSALDSLRAQEMIRLFKAIAPDYIIYAEDFVRIVSAADWSSGGAPPATPRIVFQRFDAIGCGAIDWREFMVHLILWSEPLCSAHRLSNSSIGAFASESRNPLYIDGPSLVQLFDLKTDLGMIPLQYEHFVETELYFEVQVEPDRLAAIKDLLWEIFAVNGALDPNDFLLFLCADEQPLRGIQKAFAMGAAIGDEACMLTVDMLYRVLHFSACNYQSFGMDDRYSRPELEALYTTADTMSFQDMCGTGSGRVVLNNTTMFLRRKFSE